MADKTPLILEAGQIRQMQAGDTVPSANLPPGGPSSDPSYSPGSFTVANETAKIMSRHLKLTTTQRATLAGTATLRIT